MELHAKHKLLQWNLNGFNKKINELKILIAEHLPDLLCLQETNFTDKSYKTLRNYTCYNKNRTNGLRASGGVAIYVKTALPSTQINIITHLEAIAISVHLNESNLNICNLYIPNQTKIEISDIENIIKQLPKPFIILGDFNAHSTIWGSEKTDNRGKIIEKLLENDNIVLLNDTSPTHINFANGTLSCIDLTICSSTLAQRLKWRTLSDIHSSDHLPIITNFMIRKGDTNKNKSRRWNLKTPNWTLFSDIVENEITKIQHNDQSNIENTVETLTNIITSAAELSIGSSINYNNKPKVPWWNDDIKRAIQNKKNALNIYKKQKTQENFIQLKKLRAQSKFLIKKSKKNSWKEFTTSINSKTNSSEIWNKIHSLKGLNRNQEIHITDAQGTTSVPEEAAEKIGTYFQDNFSNKIYKQDFINEIKTPTENIPINTTINPYNSEQII